MQELFAWATMVWMTLFLTFSYQLVPICFCIHPLRLIFFIYLNSTAYLSASFILSIGTYTKIVIRTRTLYPIQKRNNYAMSNRLLLWVKLCNCILSNVSDLQIHICKPISLLEKSTVNFDFISRQTFNRRNGSQQTSW